jgi:hypothetical protein
LSMPVSYPKIHRHAMPMMIGLIIEGQYTKARITPIPINLFCRNRARDKDRMTVEGTAMRVNRRVFPKAA